MKNRIDIKNVVAVIAIIASFILAIGLALIANQRSSYWVANRDLTPGHLVDSVDFKVVKASLDRSASGYLPATVNPVGKFVTRFVAGGELLNVKSLAEDNGDVKVRLLSFAVASQDLPAQINIGDAVNLYQVVNDNGDGKLVPSQLVIEDVFVVDLNRKNTNLGGSTVVTVGIPEEFVEVALNATRRGRMVVVANHG